MQYAVEPDIVFLADALLGLAKLNVRHFRNDLGLAQTVLRRMLNGEYRWIRETPDTWQDVKQMADPKQVEFDCEDFSAALAALMVIAFGDAQVGIRCVEHQCHALAGRNNVVYDLSPLFGMPGISRGPGEWRQIKDKPMIAEGISLIASGVRRMMAQSKEPAPAQAQMETGGLANVLTSIIPPAAHARINDLEKERDALKRERNALRGERDALRKERDALKKGLADCNTARDDQSTRRVAAEQETAKTREQLAAESRALAEAKAFHLACKEQLQQVLARSSDQGARSLAREGLDRLELEKPEDYAQAFMDEEQRGQAWDMLGVGAAHIAGLPDCDACARGEPCTGRQTGAADEANGDEPPDVMGAPDSDDYTGSYEGPPSSSDRPTGFGCEGSCPR